jgi:acetyl-CoA carboxylase biotin carboxyl carrier protein
MKRRGARPAPDEPTVVELIRQLGGLLGELGLAELEVTIGDTRIRLARPTPGASLTAPPTLVTATTPAAANEFGAVATLPGAVTVEAPMVGTFYRAASPTGEPYVREGDVVKEGQILCIIEAMKLMNEIEAKAAGRIVKILAENAQAVEYGQPLFLIEPTR